MSKFRKKPVVIEAHRTDVEVSIKTLEGTMIASPGDYIITGVKGEKYPCKPDIFEATYEPVISGPVISGPVMSFGQALEELKAGKRVARAGWNGKGMWICYMPALYLDKDIINGRTKKHIGEGVDLDSQPYLVMWTAQGKWQPGWLASQADMLAEDWEVV